MRGCRKSKLVGRLIGVMGPLARDERGQGTVEYILLLMLTTGFAVFSLRTLINTVDSGILRLGAQLEKDLKSGRAPVDIWAN